MALSERYLIEGAWCALEQAGLLLRDAALLSENQRAATAKGLALLAREEIGKARILLRFIEEGGAPQNLRELQRALDNHQVKQIAGILHLPVQIQDKRLFAAGVYEEDLPEDHPDRAAQQELDDVKERAMKRLPNDRMAAREQALYVDPEEGRWSRPVEVSADEARRRLGEANYDYALLRGLLLRSEGYARSRAALEAWPDRPPLPEPPLHVPGAFL